MDDVVADKTTNVDGDGTYTVTALAALIAAKIDAAFPDEVWVQGEIRDLTRSHAGHVYFSLVDPDENGGEVVLPVTLFASEKFQVNHILKRSGGAIRMTDGIRIRIRGSVSLYRQRSSVQLRMMRIDPAFTLGQLAADRQALIKLLTRDGTLQANKRLPVPPAPFRIGVVTSTGSAAHADFLSELEGLPYAFHVIISHATVQGIDAPRSIVAAIERLREHQTDVIAVVRGGGAQTDLAVFDSERVVRAIGTATVPVLTGIGHETDQTVADLAAAIATKTPTACAAAIGELVARFHEQLTAATRRIAAAESGCFQRRKATLDRMAVRLHGGLRVHAGRHRSLLERHELSLRRLSEFVPARDERRLASVADRIVETARRLTDSADESVAGVAGTLGSASRRAIIDAARRLDSASRLVDGRNPARLFARGWSITLDEQGAPVRSVAHVERGDRLRTIVDGGSIVSTVDATESEDTDE